MDTAPPREADRARRTLWATVLVFRWAALVWMSVMALTAGRPFVRSELAWLSVGVALGWTAWLTVSRGELRTPALWFDLGLSVALLLVSAVVVPEGRVEERQLFATAYPVSAALAWGVARGPWGGLAAGVVLGAAYALTRPLNGIPFADLTGEQVQSIANGAVNFLLAGGAVGVASRLLDRSAVRADEATREAIEARERAARLAERESLARTIHDSVLQALALISKRGREMATRPQVPGGEVRGLAEMAVRQERELRALILREPAEAPSGTASLREALEAAARQVTEVPVDVSAVGPLWLPAATVEEVGAAVRQALRNVAEHASAARATVFAEAEAESGDGWVMVTVRDDGRGFDYDEERLRAEGKAGILKSMKGRIEELGGTVKVHTAPGSGTEIELRLPLSLTSDEVGR
jgi:signal transduction histidine kinase